MTEQDLAFYLNQPWSITIYKTDDPIHPWVARVTDLHSCYAVSNSPEQALHELNEEVLPLWIESTLEVGNTITLPVKPEDCKGKIAYRTTPSKHHQLLRLANRLGKSLNKVLDDAVISYLDSMA